MSLSSFIAKTGVNPSFIAFNAHCWFAFALAHTLGWWSMFPLALLAAVKEFWFDATYEVPRQTLRDNIEDYAGYAAGLVVAVLALWFHV